MRFNADRRVVLAVSAGALVLALGLVAAVLLRPGRPPAVADTGAPRAALQVRMGDTGGGKLDPKARLRCFVSGRFVGETSLAECAERNGVDAGRMDVGVDSGGQVAAAGAGAATLAPLPETGPVEAADAAPAPRPVTSPAPECLRYGAGGWRGAGVGMTLRACARVLFEGRCVRPGEALYGRYGARTLRLTPGQVESSADNRDFSFLMDQDAEACALDG